MPGFRDELLRFARQSGILAAGFEAVGLHVWPAILRKIEAAFVVKTSANTHFNQWKESLKRPQYRICLATAWVGDYLVKLIDSQEQVWFVACDAARDPSKFWLFQGTGQAIQLLLQEHRCFEYYLISKKYTWLLCETDHDVLVGLGDVIPKMQQLEVPGSSALHEASTCSVEQNGAFLHANL